MHLQIARGRLLDILDPIESLFGLFLDLPEEFKDKGDIRAILVEVETVKPLVYAACLLGFSRYPVDPNGAVDVARQVLPVQLDLDANQTVVTNPFRQSFRKAVVEAMLEIGVRYGV